MSGTQRDRQISRRNSRVRRLPVAIGAKISPFAAQPVKGTSEVTAIHLITAHSLAVPVTVSAQ